MTQPVRTISRTQIQNRTKAIQPYQKARKTRKVGTRPRYPLGLELELRRTLKLLFAPVREVTKSPEFKQALDTLLKRYQLAVRDGLDDDMDFVLSSLQAEWDAIAAFDLRRRLNRFATRIEDWNGIETARVLKGIGTVAFDLTTESLTIQREAFVSRSVRLIRGITEDQRKRISDAVLSGVQSGAGVDSIAGSINDAVDIGETRSALIARDQVSSYNAALTEERMLENGVTKFMWSTSKDERVRASHAELEGQVFEWAQPPVVDGEEAIPGSQISCRCVSVPVID